MTPETRGRGFAVAGLLVLLAALVPTPVTAGSAAAAGNDKLSVVVTGNNGEVYSRTMFLGSTWGDWLEQGRPPVGVIGGPAIAYRDNDEYVIFARGGDNALWYLPAFGEWTSAGRPSGRNLAFDPDATMWSNGHAAAFVTDDIGAVSYVTITPQQSATSWTGIGMPFGGATSGPSAVSWQDANGFAARVFAGGQNGELRSVSFSGTTWSTTWGNHKGTIRSGTSPDATVWHYQHMDAFVTGVDNRLYEKTLHGSWGGWRQLDGGLHGGPGAAALGSRVDLFVRGNDHALYQETCRWRNGETVTCQEEGGMQWDYLGGGLTSDPDAAWTQL